MKFSSSAFFPAVIAGLLWLGGGSVVARAQAPLPPAQVGVNYSFQITTTPAAAAGTVYSATGLPAGLSIGSSSGLISGTPTAPGTSTGTISLTASELTNNFDYTLVVNPAAGTPVITSALTATATVGSSFAYTATASNSPSSFNLGVLPPGLSGSPSSGVINGTPTTAGTYSVLLSANNAAGVGATKTLTITVNAAGPVPAITSPITANGLPGTAFTYSITATNSPLSFAAAGLPLGLSLDTATGIISGTPTVAGVYTVGLTAANNNGVGATTSLTLTLGALSVITSAPTASGGVNTAFSYTITASNSPVSFNVSGLPAGFAADTTTGVISGTPTAAGAAVVSLSANNAVGTGPVATLTLTFGDVPTVTSAATSVATAGLPFLYQITATNSPTSFAASGLPAGLLLNAATGVISGVPASPGTFTVTLSGTNSSGTGPGFPLLITIGAGSTGDGGVVAPAIATQPSGQTVAEGGEATFTVAATGTSPTYQWYKDGVAVAGATANRLTLAAVRAADAGSYTVTILNARGTVTSAPATLSVVPAVGAPQITVPPASQSVFVGANVTFSVAASSGTTLSYQWLKNGVPVPGATGATLTLQSVPLSAAGNYAVVVTNSAGSTTSAPGVLTVSSRTMPGSYFGSFGANRGIFALFVRGDRTGVFLGYVRSTGLALVARNLSVDASGRFAVTVTAAAPATASLGLPSTAAAEATYTIAGTIGADGTVSGTVSGLELTFSAPPAATGTTASIAGFYQAGVAGGSASSYTITGAAGDAFVVTVDGARADAGRGTVSAAGALTVTTEGSAAIVGTIQAAVLSLTATPLGGPATTFVGANNDARAEIEKLLNLSTRSQTGTGANVLIAGFVLTGSQPKPVLVRAIGPTLAQFGVNGALSAARLEIFRGPSSLRVGNDWGAASDAAAIATTAARVGAFALAPNSRDAALLLTLEPGSYTAVVSGQGNATGVSLVEVYDATEGSIPNAQRLINISSRAAVGALDATLIGGFYISGTVPKRVLIRGVGPGLAQFGLTGTLARPQLLLFRGTQLVAQNSGWSASPDAVAIAAAGAEVGAFAFGAASADAALLVNLEPGAYSAQVVGLDGSTGVALVEIYEVP